MVKSVIFEIASATRSVFYTVTLQGYALAIYEILAELNGTPIKRDQLCKAVGYKNPRRVSMRIEELKMNGIPVFNNHNGVFLVKDANRIKELCDIEHKRITAQIKREHSWIKMLMSGVEEVNQTKLVEVKKKSWFRNLFSLWE